MKNNFQNYVTLGCFLVDYAYNFSSIVDFHLVFKSVPS